jgi:hypothetical protein
MKELTNRRISSDEFQLMITALDRVEGKAVAAEEILEFFAWY